MQNSYGLAVVSRLVLILERIGLVPVVSLISTSTKNGGLVFGPPFDICIICITTGPSLATAPVAGTNVVKELPAVVVVVALVVELDVAAVVAVEVELPDVVLSPEAVVAVSPEASSPSPVQKKTKKKQLLEYILKNDFSKSNDTYMKTCVINAHKIRVNFREEYLCKTTLTLKILDIHR